MGKTVEQLRAYYNRKPLPKLVRAIYNLDDARAKERSKNPNNLDAARAGSYSKRLAILEEALNSRGFDLDAVPAFDIGDRHIYEKYRAG